MIKKINPPEPNVQVGLKNVGRGDWNYILNIILYFIIYCTIISGAFVHYCTIFLSV